MSDVTNSIQEVIEKINLLERKEQNQLLNLLFLQMQKYDTIHLIKKTVCVFLDIPFELVISKTRKENVVFARHLILYYLYKHTTNFSLTEIAVIVNLKTHADVIHACKRIEKILSIKNKFTSPAKSITERLNFALKEKMYFNLEGNKIE